MIKCSNYDSGHYNLTTNKIPFKANHLWAEYTPNRNWYVVYSYRTDWPIWAYSFTLRCWFKNIERYSYSTTCHTNNSRPDISMIGLRKRTCIDIIKLIVEDD